MTSGSSAASSPHSTMQYLSSALSQSGPNALPYSEDVKLAIRQHLFNLVQDFPSLVAKLAAFVHNDGTSVNLFHVEGTVPMTFNGLSYNIPVIIWLLESYPKSPPRVFVSPTKEMVIKRLHRHVDASGLVTLPYLHSWFYPRSNLSELTRNLSSMFSQDPPLFSKPLSPSSHSQHHRINAAASSGALSNTIPYTSSPLSSPARSQLQQLSPSSNRADSPGPTPPSQLVSSRYGRTESHRSGRTGNPSDVFRGNAINTLVDRLKVDTSELRETREADMDKLFTAQSKLKQKKVQLKHYMEQMQQEREGLEEQLQILCTNTDMLGNWLKTHSALCLDIEVDDAFEPSDPLSKQVLECKSADLALEDVIYSLDRAVQEGSIPIDVYLKQVRSLAREQFFHRALSAKIHAAQQQIQVSNMAASHGL